MTIATAPAVAPGDAPRRPGVGTLVAGIVGRTWLWFVGGCLIITMLPMLLGWHPYVVESGSMAPRIHVGDVVLASPTSSASELVGRVAVFADPSRPGTTKTHRVIGVRPDGLLTTKGDANPTADSAPVPMSSVHGMGRLLVSYAGLPLIWTHTQQWGLLLALILSLGLAGWAVSRDRDPDDLVDPDDDGDGPGGALVPFPSAISSGGGATAKAASTPMDPTLRRVTGTAYRRSVPRRVAWGVAAALALTIPTTGAAFASTTITSANAWSVGVWNYGASVTALSPWLYWKLDESSGTTAADSSGNGRAGTYNPNAAAFTRGIVGALTTETPNLAVTLNGTTACINTASSAAMNAPTQLTEVVWFKTTSSTGGKLLGFEMPQTGVAVAGSGGTYDRHLYIDGGGKVWFGVYNAGYFTVGSPTSLNDGAWHMAAASMGTGGMTLYIDGAAVGTNANSAAESTTGWFRAGCGNLAGWGGSWTGANSPTTNSGTAQNRPFAGSLDEISVWQTVLTPTQIRNLYLAK